MCVNRVLAVLAAAAAAMLTGSVSGSRTDDANGL